ncbi:2-oxoacid:acceptor oxidoreductase family protein [Tissierella praeacuta]|uniref:2-oxoacid:acceptor oxidoreductase family protein n=1 Tax=Tissierella praeacuta TaxID=43131 RepID=UPI003DA5171A
MKEIRLHGIGGLGTVKAGELLVHAAVADNKNGNSIPFFGFERQGAPVTSYVRLDNNTIRPKNQVYNPDCIIVLEPTVMNAVDVFEGLKENSVFVLNTALEDILDMNIPSTVKTIAIVDATKIALDVLKRPITNTIMLAAFAKATGWVNEKLLEEKVAEMFGEKNREAFKEGLKQVKIIQL